MSLPLESEARIGPPVPLDPELAAPLPGILEQMPQLRTPEDIPHARTVLMLPLSEEKLSRNGTFQVRDHTIAGRRGEHDITAVVVRPSSASGPTPVLYNIHGGGMIIGSYRSLTDDFLDWVEEFGFTLVSVDYRLAPETKHPGPVEDCYRGLVWVSENASELSIDPERIVIVGASAGGGLAAGTALLARDRGGPRVAAQILLCPMLDDRAITASSIQEDGRGVWDRQSNINGWNALLGNARATDDVDHYAAPARARDLSGLPPAYIDVGSAESFRDEAVAYASSIWRAGGYAELHVFAGGFHGYDGIVPYAAVSQDTRRMRSQWLRRFLPD